MPFTLGCRPISGFPSFRQLPPAQPHRKPHPEKKTHPEREKLTESPHAVLLVSQLLPAQLPRKPTATASSGTRQDSLTESRRENPQLPPAQPHRNSTASSGTRQDSLTESPHENPPEKGHMRTRQHSLTESSTQKGTNSQKVTLKVRAPVCYVEAPARMPRKL